MHAASPAPAQVPPPKPGQRPGLPVIPMPDVIRRAPPPVATDLDWQAPPPPRDPRYPTAPAQLYCAA